MTAQRGQPAGGPPARRQPSSRFRIGLLALALVAIATYFAFAKDIPFTHGYRLHAVFESSNNLRPASPVRIAGVNVGKVVSVHRYKDTDLAEVTLEIDEKGLPIHADATLKIRPRIFLEGNFFVDLRPGSPGAPEVKDGGTIGVAQTATPVQLDELLTALQADTRADLQTVLEEYGKALNSKPTPEDDASQDPDVQGLTGGEALNKSYAYAPQALRGTTLVNSALLGTQPHDLSRMIGGIARLTTALRSRESALQDLIVNFNTTAGSFAAQSGALRASIRLLGPTLTAARGAFASLDASFPSTRAFAREILPGVRETPATVEASFPWIRQTRALLGPDELRGLMAQLQPATADLARLQAGSLKLLPQIDRADRCFSRLIIPTGNMPVDDGALSARRADGSIVENFKEFWYGMVGLAGEAQNFDANGNYIRFAVGGGANLVRVGRSREMKQTVVGNANFVPRGTSPLYPKRDPKVKTGRSCYRNPLPSVNGPQAGPGPAPASTPSPPRGALPEKTTTTATTSTTSGGGQ